MSGIDRDFVDTVRQTVDLVEVVSEHVSLRRQGARYVGLCPFHDERTPSFSVSPDRQLYYCFGCGAGGDAFSFVMKIEGFDFPEAVRALAARAGLEVPAETDPAAARRQRERARLLEVMDLAARYFQVALWETKGGGRARSYLESRGISEELARTFGLGYAMPGWDGLIRGLLGKGVTKEEMERAGLVSRSERSGGRVYDRFRDRLMFPIWDPGGRVVAFGGRTLDADGLPKYVNSPETALFRKGTLWYGLHLARAGVRREGLAVVVEGYMDVIACRGHGFENAVASMGTALSRDQAWALARLAERVVIAYDADTAGAEATLRGLDMFHETGIQVRVAGMPAGKDPDDLLRDGGPDAWRSAIGGAVPLFEYRMARALARHDRRTVGGKVAVVRELTPALLSMRDEIRRAEGIRRLSEELGVAEDSIRLELARAARRAGRRRDARELARGTGQGPSIEEMAAVPAAVVKAEREIIRLVMDDPRRFSMIRGDMAGDVEPLTPDHFTVPALRAVVEAMLETAAEHGELRPAEVTARLTAEDVKQHLSGVLLEDFRPENPKRTLEDCVARLVEYRLALEIQRRQRAIREAEEKGEDYEPGLLRQLMELQERLHRLRRR